MQLQIAQLAHSMTTATSVEVVVLPAPRNIHATPLRFKLDGRPVLSAHLNVETAGSDENGLEFELRRVSKLDFVIF
jgi:hypothetical protein